jgi:hypothetical protein
VLANNAAIRRARGRFIGKIDQDTLVDKAFFSGLFAAVDGTGKDFLESSFLFAGRRSIPRKLTVRSPSGEEVLDFLDCFVRWLPKEGRGRTPWFDVPTGIVVLHRRIWWEAGGYDERLLYWGFMEAELAMHLQSKYLLVNLEELVGCPFYHLRHSTRRLTLTTRRKNPRVPPAPRQPDENLPEATRPVAPRGPISTFTFERMVLGDGPGLSPPPVQAVATVSPTGDPVVAEKSRRLLVLCERDVELFSLIQQVIANVPRAVAELQLLHAIRLPGPPHRLGVLL